MKRPQIEDTLKKHPYAPEAMDCHIKALEKYADWQAKQIKELEDYKKYANEYKDWVLLKKQIKELKEDELQLVIWGIEQFDNRAIGKISQGDAQGLIDEFKNVNKH